MDSGFDCDSVVGLKVECFANTVSRLCTKYWHFSAWDFPPPNTHARTGRSHAKKGTSLIEANKIYRAGDGIERFDNNPCEKMASKYGFKQVG